MPSNFELWFSARDERFDGDCAGTRSNGILFANSIFYDVDAPTFCALQYGPFVNLPPGRYLAEFELQPFDDVIEFMVTHRGTLDLVSPEATRTVRVLGRQTINVNFTISECTSIELKIHLRSGGDGIYYILPTTVTRLGS